MNFYTFITSFFPLNIPGEIIFGSFYKTFFIPFNIFQQLFSLFRNSKVLITPEIDLNNHGNKIYAFLCQKIDDLQFVIRMIFFINNSMVQ